MYWIIGDYNNKTELEIHKQQINLNKPSTLLYQEVSFKCITQQAPKVCKGSYCWACEGMYFLR